MRISSLQTSILVDAAHHPRILAEVAVDVQKAEDPSTGRLHHAAHPAVVMVGLAGFLFR
jgi:hypothetical protein